MSQNEVKITRSVYAALKMPASIPKFIVRAAAIHLSMSTKSRFAASAAKLDKLKVQNDKLAKVQANCKAKPPTALIVDRDKVKYKVDMLLRALQRDVMELVYANLQQAEVIITDANMVVQHFANNYKFKNRALYGTEKKSVILYAEGRGYHDWRMSLDNENWTELETTSTAKTIIKGLIFGQKYYFQNRRVLTKGRKAAWTNSVDITVR
jgi:hypothetical protein